MWTKRLSALTALAVFCVAGTAARAQSEPNSTTRPSDPPRERAGDRTHDRGMVAFHSADEMRGTEIYNQSHEKCGTIRDLVIDRGSGRVKFLVVDTRSNMNMGGKKMVIPYKAMTWDPQSKHLMLKNGTDHSENWREFNKDRWSMAGPDSLSYQLSSSYYKNVATDRYAGKDEPMHLKGRIKEIERRTTDEDAQKVIVTVVTDDGKEERVTVGPSWYLAGNSVAFFRENPVDLYVFKRTEDGTTSYYARSVGSGQEMTTLYDAEGWPAWSEHQKSDTTPGKAGKDKRSMTSPLVLASELDGKALNCRADMCGKVDDMLIECHSGHVAFVSIDPNQNFLGIADTKRLVPWSVVTVGADNKLWIDADKAMVVSAPETPKEKDLEAFANNASYKRVYGSFRVPVSEFDDPMYKHEKRSESNTSPRTATDGDK